MKISLPASFTTLSRDDKAPLHFIIVTTRITDQGRYLSLNDTGAHVTFVETGSKKLMVKFIIDSHLPTEPFQLCVYVLKVNTVIQTLQIDLTDTINIRFKEVAMFENIVWGSSDLVSLEFDDSDEKVITGFSLAKPHYTDESLDYEKDQFYIHFVKVNPGSRQRQFWSYFSQDFALLKDLCLCPPAKPYL